jgi:ribosomal protein S18 acetylase RimI-like enzyme
MTEQEFKVIFDNLIVDVTESMVHFGNLTKDDVLAQYNALLSDGFHTKGVDFHVVSNLENEEIGTVLFMERQPGFGLIMWIEIKEQFRRQGYARDVLAFVEKEMTLRNYNMIGLNVVENNIGAKALYESCGYTVHNIENGAVTMLKPLKN